MERIAWQTSEPGHCETDLVHHGGESTRAKYGHTLQMIDVATGWSERVAVLGRGHQAMEGGFGESSGASRSPWWNSIPIMGRSSSITTWCASGRRRSPGVQLAALPALSQE